MPLLVAGLLLMGALCAWMVFTGMGIAAVCLVLGRKSPPQAMRGVLLAALGVHGAHWCWAVYLPFAARVLG